MAIARAVLRTLLVSLTLSLSPIAAAQSAPGDPLASTGPRPLNRDERAQRSARPAIERCLATVRVPSSMERRRAVIELRVGRGRAAITALRVQTQRRDDCAGTIEACENASSPPQDVSSASVRACVSRAALRAAASIKSGPVRSLEWGFSL